MAYSYKIHWLAWQPTPYNDILFQALANDPEIDLTVHYRFSVLASHPWQTKLGQGYKNRFYQDGRSSLYIDYELVWRVIKEKYSIFVLVGWPGLTVKFILLLMILLKRRFLFWSDTPNVRYEKNDSLNSRIIELSKYDKPYPLWHSLIRRILYRLIFRYADVVMSTGRPGVRSMTMLGCSPNKIKNMPFFVDLSYSKNFSSENQKFSLKNPFIFVSSGQLVYRKRYDIAIKALSIVKRKIDVPFRYLIIGDGPERASLEGLSFSNNIANEVEILGWQEPKRLKDLLIMSNAFVHPSQNDPFPVAVLEAMAAGLPILGSDVSGSVLDRVEPGANGFIHRAGDVNQLAEHMIKLLTDPKLSFQMGRAARQTAEQWPVSKGVDIIKKAI